jgi:hypothetical protein
MHRRNLSRKKGPSRLATQEINLRIKLNGIAVPSLRIINFSSLSLHLMIKKWTNNNVKTARKLIHIRVFRLYLIFLDYNSIRNIHDSRNVQDCHHPECVLFYFLFFRCQIFLFYPEWSSLCMISHSCAKSNNSLYDYNDTRPIIEAQQVIASGEGFRQLRTDTRNYRT